MRTERYELGDHVEFEATMSGYELALRGMNDGEHVGATTVYRGVVEEVQGNLFWVRVPADQWIGSRLFASQQGLQHAPIRWMRRLGWDVRREVAAS